MLEINHSSRTWELICYKTAPERQTSWSEEENPLEWAFGEWCFRVAGAELTVHLHGDGLLLPHLVVMATPFFTQALLLSRESMKRATSPLPTMLPAGFPLLSGTKYPSWVRNSWAGEEAKANRGATYTACFEEWKMHRDTEDTRWAGDVTNTVSFIHINTAWTMSKLVPRQKEPLKHFAE